MKRKPELDDANPAVDAFIGRAKATRAEQGKGKPPAQGFTRTSFDLPNDLYEELKILAVRQRRPMRELVETALRGYIDE